MNHLLKPSDVVRWLGTSRSWVYEAAKRGDIPSIRLGGRDGPLRFIEADVQSWIDDARARWRPGGPPRATRSMPPASRPATSPTLNGKWAQLELDA